MSKITELIFHGEKHVLTSAFGARTPLATSKGSTGGFHSGADYGTYGKKLPQYAIEDGEVLSCGIDAAYGGAKYVWVKYPRLGVKMLHYHLDQIKVKAGQKVNKNTVLGTTGMTGKATGIHLHLGIKRLSGGDYIDPEKWAKEEYAASGKPPLPPLKGEVAERSSDGGVAAPKGKNPTKPTEEYAPGNYKVTKANLLHVRKGPGTGYAQLKYAQLTNSAKSKILLLNKGKKADGYVKNLTFTALEVKGNWGRTPSGWVCLEYCQVIK